jgi:diguanylate cyclase (GGDEF)-like protein/PAS domain S-box-containing protein
MTDVNEYYQKLNQNEQIINRYEKLMNTINEGIWDWDVNTGNIFFSRQWYELLGYSDNEIPGTHDFWKESVHPEDLGRVMDAIEKHFSNETPQYDHNYRLKTKKGNYIWVRDRGIKHLNDKGEIERMIGSLCDITSEKKTREKLEKMIITDELTGLFNRRHYDSQISDEILRAERYGSELSIIMIDIDLFKQINDTYGHHAGDIALKDLSAVIGQKIRNTDSAFRTGGEEFIVIATATNLENAMKAAERLRIAANRIKVKTKYGEFSFTISLGVTTFKKGDTYFSLNERVDIALYKSKDLGRNRSTPYI